VSHPGLSRVVVYCCRHRAKRRSAQRLWPTNSVQVEDRRPPRRPIRHKLPLAPFSTCRRPRAIRDRRCRATCVAGGDRPRALADYQQSPNQRGKWFINSKSSSSIELSSQSEFL